MLKGHPVTKGYEHNEEANRASFTAGWFDSGDLGWLDSDGFLYITGRSKEVTSVPQLIISHDIASKYSYARSQCLLGTVFSRRLKTA